MADYFEERGDSTFDVTDEEAVELNRSNMLGLIAASNLFAQIGVPNQSAPPASKTAVDKLVREKVVEKGGECLVCLKEYEVGESTTIMPCKHSFHSTCLLEWLTKTNSCPLCRHELPTDNVIYEAYRLEKLRVKQREEDLQNLHNSMFT